MFFILLICVIFVIVQAVVSEIGDSDIEMANNDIKEGE